MSAARWNTLMWLKKREQLTLPRRVPIPNSNRVQIPTDNNCQLIVTKGDRNAYHNILDNCSIIHVVRRVVLFDGVTCAIVDLTLITDCGNIKARTKAEGQPQ